MDKKSVKALLRAIDDFVKEYGEPPRLLIIDTLARNFGPGNENDTVDMGRLVAVLDEIRTRYGCSILIVHHTGLTSTERARGSSVLRASIDWEYRVSRNEDRTITLTCTKSKDFEPPEPLILRPKVVTLDWVDDQGRPLTSLVMEKVEGTQTAKRYHLTGPKRIAYDCLVKHGAYISTEQWKDLCYDRGISPGGTSDSKRKAFKRAVADLLDMNFVGTKDDFWWPITYETGQMNGINNLEE